MGIDSLIAFCLNFICLIRDFAQSQGKQPNNTITLQCVCTDDLPIDVRNSYCKSLEIIYAMMIRSLLTLQNRSRLNDTPTSIMGSLPMLTPYDKVKFNDKINGFISVRDSIFNRNKQDGQKALDVFTESLQDKLDEFTRVMNTISIEDANVILKGGSSAAPTFIEISLNINEFSGRVTEKKFSLGIQVRPKVVSSQEMMQFIVKRNNAVAEVDGATRTFWQRMKNSFIFNYKRVKNSAKSGEIQGEKTLNQMMESVKNIKKPFVCLLMSNLTVEGLKDLNIDLVENFKIAQKLYETLPIMSISIYNANTDTITSSLTKDSYFVSRTAAEFNSEVSQYEKQLAEMVRVQRMF